MAQIPQNSLAQGYNQPSFQNGQGWGADLEVQAVLLSSTNQLDNCAGRWARYTADGGNPGTNNGAPLTCSVDTTSTNPEGGIITLTNSLSSNFVPGGAGSDFSYIPNGSIVGIIKAGDAGVFLGPASAAGIPGDYLAYKNADTSASSNDAGTLICYSKGGTPPTGFTKVPNAKLNSYVLAGGGLATILISKGNS